MKELSIEEKARRYDEAIAKFNVILNLNTVKESGTIFADDVRKIFSELAESEDERIRKGIIKILETFPSNTTLAKSVNKEECIAWLEKQNSNVDNANKEYWIGYREGKQEILDKYSELEKQGEQKPAWSEEDESRITVICTYLQDYARLSGSESRTIRINEYCDWLKSLKERVQLKQEWSEEDERYWSIIIAEFSKCAGKSVSKDEWMRCNDFLNSLRDRYNWKPSEEQIKVLEFFIPYVTKCSIVLEKSKGTLLSLLSDLKKLKG